ncbi:MAG: aminotransferase class IV [Chitinophagaceae bacterium]
MSYLNLNGKILAEDKPVLMASNRSYRYGDGLFETMRIQKNRIVFANYHFERLYSSLTTLKYDIPSLYTPAKLEKEILQLCQRNHCENLARVRLSVFRGNGGINDDDKNLQYLIECWPLSSSVNQLNENGLVIDIYPDAQKSTDNFSNIKSANFLPYSMAALYAKQNKLNECLVLNTAGKIADATIANLFLIKDGTIKTPSLDQGCVNGIMRRYLSESLSAAGSIILETSISIEDVKTADEVFLTNATSGIRWVSQFADVKYGNAKTIEIYNRFIKTINL